MGDGGNVGVRCFEKDHSHSRSVYNLHTGDWLQIDGEGAHRPVDLVELPIRFRSVSAFPDSQV